MDRKYKDCIITYVLMGICIIVYLYTTLRYGVEMSAMEGIEVGGFNPLYIYYDHEYFRFITANFIHFGLMHIFCNIYSLYNLGILMEKILKKKKYAIVIIVSMLSTTCFSYLLFLLFNSVMGGISGVIFGLIGSLLALAILYKDIYSYLFKQIATSVLLMFFISVAIPSISLSGHIGGMLGGFVTTIILEKINIKKKMIIN